MTKPIEADNVENLQENDYVMTMSLTASFTVDVKAKNFDEAKAKLEDAFDSADFGDAANIDGELVWYSENGISHDVY